MADEATLIEAARAARESAFAPYSRFKVGAALETGDGTIVTGCNIENSTYGLTVCAERVAVFKAVSEGHRAFRRIAVVADTQDPTPPWGNMLDFARAYMFKHPWLPLVPGIPLVIVAMGFNFIGDGHEAVRHRVPEDLRSHGRHAPDGGEPVLGH